MLNSQSRKILVTGFCLLGLAVLLGAFGAHGLKNLVTPEKLVTFETGVRYHFGIVLIGMLHQFFPLIKIKISFILFLIGIVLFSFNCYLYVITGLKVFALIVPVGGTAFLIGWFQLAWQVHRFRN
jgi:uncharacterized membrane protein YgdD (TMEM256/DUF423 family)